MEMIYYSRELRTRKYVKWYGFLLFARNLSDKYGKKLLNTVTKTEIDDARDSSKTVVHKTAEAIGGLIGNKIVKKIV